MNNNKPVEEYSRSQIKKATVVSYIALAINILSGFLFTPWLIHKLGNSDYGIYSIGTSIIALLIMDFGISEAVAKYVAQYRAEGKEEKVSDLLSIVMKIYLLMALIFLAVFIVLYFFLGHIYVRLTQAELERLKITYIIIALYNVFAFTFTPLSGIMLAYEHLLSLKLCDIITRLATIAITVVAIWMGMGLFSAVIANAISGIIVIIYKLLIIQNNHHFRLNPRYKDEKLLRSILSFSVWVAVLIITQRCVYSITPSILGALSGSESATIYSISSTLEGYAYSFGSVICTMFLAKITRLLNNNDTKGFQRLVIDTGKIQFILISIILVGFVCVGQEFILLWMKEGYEVTYYQTILLLAPDLFIWPFMTASVGLTVADHVREQALVNLGTAVINIAAECILVGRYGAMGAIISIAIANSFKGIALIVVYVKYLPIKVGEFIKEVFCKYGVVGVISLVIGYTLVRKICFANGWVHFILCVSTVVTVYIGVLLFMLIILDRNFLKNIITMIRRNG